MVKSFNQLTADLAPIFKATFAILLALFTVRLMSLGLYPFFDTTEARYGEIARLMFETQNWVTPQFDYNVPFWGKPPFHTWVSAISFSIFGVNEFFARLPHLLVGALTGLIVFRFTALLTNTRQGLLSVFILASTFGFILAIGMVMTDSSLLLAYTLAMTSFWLNYNNYNPKLHGHMFFAALALGMLVKGPVVVVLIVIALSVWSIWQGQFLKAISSLPWKTGFPLFWLLVIPWYAWAEYRTPGFIEYFIVGEHIQRFLVSGWEGDLYGSAHDRPRGMIWVFWLACAFPWSFFVIKDIFFKSKKTNKISLATPNIKPYLIGWLLAPLLLFTMAGNILPIYVMPSFSAMAILLATKNELSKRFVISGSITLLMLVLLLAFLSLGLVKPQTEQRLLTPELAKLGGAKIYYWKKRPFSAQFYSRGQAKLIGVDDEFNSLLSSDERFFIVVNSKKDIDVVVRLDAQCERVKSVDKKSLYQCN